MQIIQSSLSCNHIINCFFSFKIVTFWCPKSTIHYPEQNTLSILWTIPWLKPMQFRFYFDSYYNCRSHIFLFHKHLWWPFQNLHRLYMCWLVSAKSLQFSLLHVMFEHIFAFYRVWRIGFRLISGCSEPEVPRKWSGSAWNSRPEMDNINESWYN